MSLSLVCVISPRWVFKHIFTISLQSGISNVFSNGLLEQMRSHIGCICKVSLQSEFSCVASICPPNQMQSHIGCICAALLQSVVTNVPSIELPE